MPLKPGKANIGPNIKTEESVGKKHSQAVAIALHVAAVPKKPGRGGIINRTAK
jgi:hypothetical protein